jgi:gamma-glutamyl phosphate reductase
MSDLVESLTLARDASLQLEAAGDELLLALGQLAEALREQPARVIEASRLDREQAGGLDGGLLGRADLEAMATELEGFAGLEPPGPDPRLVPRGAQGQVRPRGVVGFAWEGGPRLAVRALGMALATRNALLLSGPGAARSGLAALVELLQERGLDAGLPLGFLRIVEDAEALLSHADGLDLAVLRGELARTPAAVPTRRHLPAIGLAYVDRGADPEAAAEALATLILSPEEEDLTVDTVALHEAVGEAVLHAVATRWSAGGVDADVEGLAAAWWGAAAPSPPPPGRRRHLEVVGVEGWQEALEGQAPRGHRPMDVFVGPDDEVATAFAAASPAGWVARDAGPAAPPRALAWTPEPVGPEALVRTGVLSPAP